MGPNAFFFFYFPHIYKPPNVGSCEDTERAQADQKEFLEFREAAD